ncbi:hypothetical protein GCK72_009539 [Caenorhabditis remanei]|uniref:G-protein coupled receptors family 1 profile domain-containing protein n=1 Tax=Caenorhabditis remanei TaxID=31234 RepID=A0A6A5H3B9_CAERE|nr:hypothetical protein GCK72_009539 [Caenorhabditis remanei]KAF1761284.1 hypothetical protein GCK72_009539 [Caenorhabditis remanei]
MIDSNISLSTLTITPLTYRDRITVEFGVYGTCVVFNLLLCIFFVCRPHLLRSFKPTIFFVTLGTFVLSLPLFFLQFYLVVFLWSLVEPQYTVAVCTFVKCITSSTTSCAQVLPLPVAIFRYFIVVRNRKMPSWFVVVVHSFISVVFFVIAMLNYPLGEFETNDQCAILRFSKAMEAVRISLTLGLNLFAVFINVAIYTFVKKYDKRSFGQ